MKKMKEAKEEKINNEPEMKICEHTKSISKTNWWVSQLKKVFFFKNQDGESECFFFFVPTFVLFSSALRKISVSFSLPLYIPLRKPTFQVINMSFLNEMWYKGLIQRIFGCGDFFFFFWLRKLKIWWCNWTSRHFSHFALW